MTESDEMRSVAASSGLAGLLVGASVTVIAISIPTVVSRVIAVSELPSEFTTGIFVGMLPSILFSFIIYIIAQWKMEMAITEVSGDD